MDDAADRLAINDVLFRYAYFLDSGRRSRIAEEIFTPDAAIDYGGEPVRGKAAIDAFFVKFPATIACSHLITNAMIEVDGDSARSLCRAMAWYWSDFSAQSSRLAASDLLAMGGIRMSSSAPGPAGGSSIAFACSSAPASGSGRHPKGLPRSCAG